MSTRRIEKAVFRENRLFSLLRLTPTTAYGFQGEKHGIDLVLPAGCR
jgi:hypothetical protein